MTIAKTNDTKAGDVRTFRLVHEGYELLVLSLPVAASAAATTITTLLPITRFPSFRKIPWV